MKTIVLTTKSLFFMLRILFFVLVSYLKSHISHLQLVALCFIFFLYPFQSNLLSQWFEKSNGLQKQWDYANAIDAIDSSNAIISLRSGIFKTTDGGENWVSVNFNFQKHGEVVDISMLDELNIWFCTYKGKIFFTNNGSSNWQLQYYNTSKTKFINYIEMFDLQNGIAMGDALDRENDPAVILKTTDGGSTWISINDSAFGGVSGDPWRRIDFVNLDVGYFYESGKNPQGIYKTLDGCQTWEQIHSSIALTNLKIFNKHIGLFYDINAKAIKRTLDGGMTWESSVINSDGWGNDIEFLPNNPSNVWFTDYENLFFSSDTGRTWEKQIMPKDTIRGGDIVFTDENNGWLLCNNGYVYRTSNNGGMITNVEKEKPNNLPIDFKLEQNYPNPFNPATTINYSIPGVVRNAVSHNNNNKRFSAVPDKNGRRESLYNTSMKVYDILGKEIATLVNEQKPSGNYSVEFNAKNLSSGIYYYQLIIEDFVETKKMVLLR